VANCQAWRARMGKEGVSAAEQGRAIRLLRRALEQAVAWEMIPKNPAAHIKVPRYRAKEAPYIRAEVVPRYLEAARGDPYEALFVVAILGGPRPSELLALRWEDFDEEAGAIKIDESVSHLAGGELDWNEPKSEMGRRVVPLVDEGSWRSLRTPAYSTTANNLRGTGQPICMSLSRLRTFLATPILIGPPCTP
jgi:integrase